MAKSGVDVRPWEAVLYWREAGGGDMIREAVARGVAARGVVGARLTRMPAGGAPSWLAPITGIDCRTVGCCTGIGVAATARVEIGSAGAGANTVNGDLVGEACEVSDDSVGDEV